MKFVKLSIPLAIAALCSSVYADGYSYSGWLNTIGATKLIQAQSGGGAGMILGIIDTGIVASNPQFGGRVSSTSACANVTWGCGTTGIVDDTGHGTAVAAIAAGNFVNSKGISMVGVAPAATILVEKAFTKGLASDTDYASGITKAVDGGASVINISGTYSSSKTLVNAINYAASKGVYVVFAAGNNGLTTMGGANTVGLTPSGVKHLVFVGALNNSGMTKTSFSATPGSGSLVDTNGIATSYATNWIMAPGENIVAPNMSPAMIKAGGSSVYSYWSGTSFSAPMVSGSLILLEGTWKILKTNSTAAELLFKTATSKGATSTYGNGEVNLTKAFAPFGNLMVTQANGTKVAATSLTTAVVSSGALGALSAISAKLSNFTSFDSYTRNYSINLSNLIATATNKTSVATLVTMNPTPIITRFNTTSFSLVREEVKDLQLLSQTKENWATLVSTDAGAVFGTGSGFAFNNAYSNAFYGDTTMAFNSDTLNVSNGLMSLANGGKYFAYGMPVGGVRVAFSSVQTADVPNALWNTAEAKGSSVGFSTNIDKVMIGVSVGNLQEQHGLLGTQYNTKSPLAFGNSNDSSTVGVSVGYASYDSSFLFEAATAKVAGNDQVMGLMMGMSDLTATSWGLAYTQKNSFRSNDSMTFAVKSPMRVTKGSAKLFTQDVDTETGVPFSKIETVSLVPEGVEMNYSFGYTTPVSKTANVSFNLALMTDMGNIKGNDGALVGLKYISMF